MFQNHCVPAGDLSLLRTFERDVMYAVPNNHIPLEWQMAFVELRESLEGIPHIHVLNGGMVQMFWPKDEMVHAQFDMVCDTAGLAAMERLFSLLNANCGHLLPLYELSVAKIPYPAGHPRAPYLDTVERHFTGYAPENFMPVWRICFRKPLTNHNYQALAEQFRQAFEQLKGPTHG